MTKSKIEILLEANNKITAQLKIIEGQTKNFAKTFKKSSVEINAQIELIQKGLRAVQNVFALVERGAKFTQTKKAFNDLTSSVGADSDLLIEQMQRMSGETLSTSEIMQNASKAMALGLETSKLPELMEISRAAARAFGQDVSFMFDSIVLGIGRQSKLILDNLGIIVSAKTAYEDMSRSLGKNVKELTEAERKQAFMNAAVKQGQDLVKKINISQASQLENIQKLKAEWTDFNDNLAEFLSESPIVKKSIDALTTALDFWLETLKSIDKGVSGGGLLADLNKELRITEAQLENQREGLKGIAGIFNDEKKIQENINRLLIEKERIILTIQRVTKEISEADTSVETAKELLTLEQQRAEELERIRDSSIATFDVQRLQFEAEKEGLESLLETFTGIQKQAIFSTTQLLSNSLNTLSKGLSGSLSAIILGTKKTSEAFKDLGQAMVKTIVDYVAQFIVAQTITRALSTVMMSFVTTQATALAAIWAPAAFLANVATLGGASGVGGASLTSGAVAFQGFVTGLTSAISQVPALAEGGIVPATPGGRLAIIGEGGRDEAVIPLDEDGGSSRIGGNITIIIENANLSSDQDIFDTAESLGRELENASRTGRSI